MKKIFVLMIFAIFFFTGCQTVPKKNILFIYSGLGVDVYYKSIACQTIADDMRGPVKYTMPGGQVKK